MAARRLERLDREHEEKEDKKHEASLTGAFADKTKVANLVVQNLFVDNGFGFRKDPTGEVVFIKPASYKVLKCSWSAQTHGRKS